MRTWLLKGRATIALLSRRACLGRFSAQPRVSVVAAARAMRFAVSASLGNSQT